MTDLKLEIISPTGVIFKDDCAMAVIPSLDGDIGIMHGHEAIIAALKTSAQIIIYGSKQNIIKSIDVTHGGFAQMQGLDKLLVLID